MAEVEELVNAVDNVVSRGLHTVLEPLVNKVKDADRKFELIASMLKELPEFKDLATENRLLRERIAKLENNVVLNVDSPSVHSESGENGWSRMTNSELPVDESIPPLSPVHQCDNDPDQISCGSNDDVPKEDDLEESDSRDSVDQTPKDLLEESVEETISDQEHGGSPATDELMSDHEDGARTGNEEPRSDNEEGFSSESEVSVELGDDDDELDDSTTSQSLVNEAGLHEILIECADENGDPFDDVLYTHDDHSGELYEKEENGSFTRVGKLVEGEPEFYD